VRVVGIDYSVRAIDLVALPFDGIDLDDAVWRRVELGPERGERGAFTAALRVRERLLVGFDWSGVQLVYVEDPMSVNLGTAKVLGRVCGAILASLPLTVRKGATINAMPVQDWKRILCGSPNASKQQVRRRCEQLGFLQLGTGQDAFDAAGIAWAARDENQRAIREAEVLA
jgi:Holliday junction resolvasome RuvABC endonuclease subunit